MRVELDNILDYVNWFKKKLKLNYYSKNAKNRIIFRGEVYYCNLGMEIGSELQKERPCIIIQNNLGNKHSPTTIVAPITNSSGIQKISVKIKPNTYKRLDKSKYLTGYIDLSQIRIVSKARLCDKITDKLDTDTLDEMDKKTLTSLGLKNKYEKLIYERQKDKEKIKELITENYSLKKIKNLLDNIDLKELETIIIKTTKEEIALSSKDFS